MSECFITIFSLFITGQTGKETFDDKDVGTIAEMALTKVIQMVKAQMAEALGERRVVLKQADIQVRNKISTGKKLHGLPYVFMRNSYLNPVLLMLLKGNSPQKKEKKKNRPFALY